MKRINSFVQTSFTVAALTSLTNVLTFCHRGVELTAKLSLPAHPVHQLCAGLGLSLVLFGVAFAQAPNMDVGLAATVRAHKVATGLATATINPAMPISYDSLAQKDPVGRVLVEIVLDGSVSIDQFRSTLLSLGANIAGENPHYRNGAISAYLPLATMEALGSTRGVSNLALGYKPITNVGLVTSQGVKVMHSDIVNSLGFTGNGITVGVLSDSFDALGTASKDVGSKDLPTMKFVNDNVSGTDEGRAMAQIVYDVAPNSSLCFETASTGLATFASNIRDLRTNSKCFADVIVDDEMYFTEPFFSDGQIAQAVNDVVTSTVLPGKQVAYFSAAGNQQSSPGNLNGGGFDANPAHFPTATSVPGIHLGTISSCPSTAGGTGADTGGGFLDFANNRTFAVDITFGSNSVMVMQWDDPFDRLPSGITTDLNYLFFDTSGNCQQVVGANNFTTNEAVEIVSGPPGTYKMMIARTSVGTHEAMHVKLVAFGSITSSIFGNAGTPVTFGHSAAANAISVAAYRYTDVPKNQSLFIPTFETFSSPGPVTIAFDALGNRLPFEETRNKPDLAAPDGVDNTFFGGYDWEPDGFPNFFGTSAAAPHAAGVAALMLQKAGGPGSLAPTQLKSYMLTSIPARVIPNSGSSNKTTGWSPFDGFGLLDATMSMSLTRKPTTVGLTINPTSTCDGCGASVTVNVTAGATGHVTLVVNACSVMTELQTAPLTPATFTSYFPYFPCPGSLNPQTYTVTAHYLGDGTFAPGNSSPVKVQVYTGLPM